MKIAPLPTTEQEGLMGKHKAYVPDALPDADFDDIIQIASKICGTSALLVSVIDANRQWSKSTTGLGVSAISEYLPLSGGIAGKPGELFVIPDLTKDKRFHDHPCLGHEPLIVFYAEVPLLASGGHMLGALCIMDNVERKLDIHQADALQALARQVVAHMELRELTAKYKKRQAELKMACDDLGKIAHIASHDLKSPLNNIISLTHLLKEDYAPKFDDDGREYIDYLNDAAYHLSDLVSGILTYTRTSLQPVELKENISIPRLAEEVIGQLNFPANVLISYPKGDVDIYTSRTALKQIFLHLLHNAIRYNVSDPIRVNMTFKEDEASYVLEVSDNGPGIAETDREKIFELFEKLNGKLKDGESMGIGLAIVKRLVEKLDGTIIVNTAASEGSSFLITIPK
jgi:signal transduction histidine kinase